MLLNNKGFTLIEIIVVLILVGIISAIAGMGIIKVTEGLILTQENASKTLKTQVALIRIDKELFIGKRIFDTSSPDSLTFENVKAGGSATYTLCKNGNYINLSAGATCTSGDHLIDNVNSLTFAYLASDGTTTVAAAVAKIIQVTFEVSGAAGITSSFTMRVAPRMLY